MVDAREARIYNLRMMKTTALTVKTAHSMRSMTCRASSTARASHGKPLKRSLPVSERGANMTWDQGAVFCGIFANQEKFSA